MSRTWRQTERQEALELWNDMDPSEYRRFNKRMSKMEKALEDFKEKVARFDENDNRRKRSDKSL